ncbi:hypothetical protein C0J52_05366 [Blattella germanica]|nr:hypothetical protein C0J52_05366 [Blattella germanica]
MFTSNYTTACSKYSELRNESDLYGNRPTFMQLEYGKEIPTSGPNSVDARKLDLLAEYDESFNILEGSQHLNISSSMPSVSCEYWKSNKSNATLSLDQRYNSQETQTLAKYHQKHESLSSSQNSFPNICSTIQGPLPISKSRPSSSVSYMKLVKQNPQNSNGSVEIKVEVDPNLYVNCEASSDSWTDSRLKNIHNENGSSNSVKIPDSDTRSKINRDGEVTECKDTGICNSYNRARTVEIEKLGFSASNNKVNPSVQCSYEADQENKSDTSHETDSEMLDDSDDSDMLELTQDSSENCDIAEGDSEEQIDIKLSKFYNFRCLKCEELQTFSNFQLLIDHSKHQHQTEASVSCCGQTIWERDKLNHLKEHLPKPEIGPFHCPHCDRKFSSKYGLANHMNLHLPEDERPYKCQHCNKGFGAKHAMTKHERTHLPDEERLSYVCDICGKRFGYASTLDGHQRHVHQNERPFVCHVCAKTFPIKGALTYHLTTHEVQDRVQCSQCGIWLKNEKILRIHKKCHEGELFACPHCDKVSSTRNNLRMHMKRHSDARPHSCPLCSRAFKTPRDLKTHMVQHTGQKPYSCPYCPKTFASPSNFYAHRKMKHKMSNISLESLPNSSELNYQY